MLLLLGDTQDTQLDSLAATRTDIEYAVISQYFLAELSIQSLPPPPCLGTHHFCHRAFRPGWNVRLKSTIIRLNSFHKGPDPTIKLPKILFPSLSLELVPHFASHWAISRVITWISPKSIFTASLVHPLLFSLEQWQVQRRTMPEKRHWCENQEKLMQTPPQLWTVRQPHSATVLLKHYFNRKIVLHYLGIKSHRAGKAFSYSRIQYSQLSVKPEAQVFLGIIWMSQASGQF